MATLCDTSMVFIPVLKITGLPNEAMCSKWIIIALTRTYFISEHIKFNLFAAALKTALK
jgi:hypothetical protein